MIFFRGGGIAADVGYIPTFETVGMCVGKVFQKKKKKKKKNQINWNENWNASNNRQLNHTFKMERRSNEIGGSEVKKKKHHWLFLLLIYRLTTQSLTGF